MGGPMGREGKARGGGADGGDPPGIPGPPSRRLVLGAVAALFLAVGAAYAGVRGNGFVDFDDDRYITANPHTQDLTAENLRWMFTDTSLFYWHPLAYLVHAAEVRLWGMDPLGHHLTSVLLHAVNTGLVLLLFLATARAAGTRAPPTSVAAAGFAAALLFGLHPLRVESVAWASEKKDLLSALFFLLCLLAWLRYGSAREGEPRGRWFGAAMAALALSLMAKPMAMTAPVVLLLLDAWPLGRAAGPGAWRRLLLEKVPFLVLALAAVLPSALDPRQEELLPGGAAGGPGERLTASLWGFAFGVVKTAFPDRLVPYYPLEFAENLTLVHPRYALSALLLAAGTAAALLLRRRGRPEFLAAWAFYLVTTAPVSGLRQAGGVETADRFSYLPSVGLFLLLGGGWLLWMEHGRRVAEPLAAALLLAFGLGVLTARQVEVWRDGETLWTRVVAAYPGRATVAHTNLGGLLHRRGLDAGGDATLLDRAEREYREALRIDPRHEGAHNNLGMLLLHRGEPAEARRHLEEAVALRPDFGWAHANLARLHLEAGRRDEAREAARRARAGRGPLPPFLEAVERALAGTSGQGPPR